MNKPVTEYAALAIEHNRQSRQMWQGFDDAQARYQARAKHRYNVLCAVREAGMEIGAACEQYNVKPERFFIWNGMVHGVEKSDWLPALLGTGWSGVRAFDNGAPMVDFAAILSDLVTSIDAIIDEKLRADDGDCGFMTVQAGHYFQLAETLRAARTQAQKLNEVKL